MHIPVYAQLADSFILSKLRAATGGRLRIALSGSAAISRDTQEFLTALQIMLIQDCSHSEVSVLLIIVLIYSYLPQFTLERFLELNSFSRR